MNRRLPVTLVGGFFGAGKTSLLHHFISEHQGGHLAMLVENPGTLNLDAKALGGLCGAMRRNHDMVVEIPNGDENMQAAWIAARLREFSLAGRFERVLIEVAGTANAARLAEYLNVEPRETESVATWAELSQVVCAVDALDFSRRNKGADSAFADFQDEQIAGASLLILNKCDLIDDEQRNLCTRQLRSINPGAMIIETEYGEVPPEILSRAATRQELKSAIERRPPPRSATESTPAKEPVLASALYRVHRPFHPARFWDWYNSDHPELLRVKGLIWLATRNPYVGGVSRTRWQNSCGAAGIWWAALPREDWPEDVEALARMQSIWKEPYGDRRQELVLVGEASQLSALTRQLDACLLNAEEISRPVTEWSRLSDPFPSWDLEEG